jgi:hypothetical protein
MAKRKKIKSYRPKRRRVNATRHELQLNLERDLLEL